MSSNKTQSARGPDTLPDTPDECEVCGEDEFVPNWLPKTPGGTDDDELGFAYHACGHCGTEYNDRRDEFPAEVLEEPDDDTPVWRRLFGHPEPYDHQEDAIQHVKRVGADRGYSVIEGGCGTGKTMIALTAGLALVRDPNTQYQRIMVLTSVKQQLRQFEDDLRIINQNLAPGTEPATAVTLVGKTDVCPYAREETAGFTRSNTNRKCRRLRGNTRDLISDDSITGIELADGVRQSEGGGWSTEGVKSPYDAVIPGSGDHAFCPFYAEYKGQADATFRAGHARDGITTPEEVVRLGVQAGVCPHSAMSQLCNETEVIIANYYHAFDPNTLNITGELIDEGTFLVCDEAHMLEPRVRGILSEEVSMSAFRGAVNELARVDAAVNDDFTDHDRLNDAAPPDDIVLEALADAGVNLSEVTDSYRFLKRAEGMFRNLITDHLDEEVPGWETTGLTPAPQTIELPLRDPAVPQQDAITEWAENLGVPERIWTRLPAVADAVANALNEYEGAANDRAITDTAELFRGWWERDYKRYFREITLFENDSNYGADDWQSEYEAKIQLHNCMPRRVIGKRLQNFGGGLLMSATLEPLDVYQEVTGLDYIAEFETCPVTQRTYNVSFPEENRYSAAVDLPAYTYSNRGDVAENTQTRRQYAKAILSVVETTPGNVLVCMPSYAEAEWAADLLEYRDTVDKPVLLDESSTEEVTQELKQKFFTGPGKVLLTSLRGTLTEGVDYDGDKLNACVVAGVPIENVGSPQTEAVHTAYKDDYGYKKGFEYGLTVPAVRKSRQALGRVIRGAEDVGVRVLLDERYCSLDDQEAVREYLSEIERNDYDVVDNPDTLRAELEEFWRSQ
ncbi:ATP-dependent DNA helicase [Salinibaculum rarum]|uniref:ATP-dependent DNA helicase n=1 Tax=Salinibaculum rarum TaxID=3058903 RepID=UPI0026601D63|nr:ATP-dependent DNA helicase [Salinibaculum sp. KK48]